MKIIPPLIIAIMVAIFFCSVKTIYKVITTSTEEIDTPWVRNYVTKRELIRIFLSMVLLALSYYMYGMLFPSKTMFTLLALGAGCLILISIVRIVFVRSGSDWCKITAAKCLDSHCGETGSDVDSASPYAKLSTTAGDFTFYGYGASMFFASNIQKDDTILMVNFKWKSSPYMLLGIPKTAQNLSRIP